MIILFTRILNYGGAEEHCKIVAASKRGKHCRMRHDDKS